LRHIPNAYFVVAGTGDMEGQVMQEVARCNLSERFFFAGRYQCAEIVEFYRGADLYVFPSVSEPFGITPLEAVMNGAPVLLSKQSGVAEVMHHALMVDFWDLDDMENKSVTLLRNPALARTMRLNARREIRGINWESAGKKVENIYSYLLHA